jgi:hypothetical protein
MHHRNLLSLFALWGLAVPGLISQQAKSSTLPPPTVTSGIEGILEAFQTHPVVGLGDIHGMAQEEDFYAALIRDPRFAKDVGNVVVEFGDAAEQETINRYINGEDVPYEQLRKVWADTVGWVPTVTSLGYMNFYAEVRAVNLTLPPTERIRVWLGDPPVDWSKIKTRADLSQLADRNQYPADLIKTTILAQKRKALVIYGSGHLFGNASLRTLVEQSYPDSFFVVTPYFGFTDRGCSEAFESKVRAWPNVALATPVRNSALQDEMHAPGCHFVGASDFSFDKTATEGQKAKAVADIDDKLSGVAGNALLYLGSATGLTQSPIAPDLYLDMDFRKEIGRRFQIITGGSMVWPSVAANPMSPRYVRSYGGVSKEAR